MEKIKETKLAIKIFFCLVCLIIITFLSIFSYQLYQEEYKAIPWSEAKNTNNYTYIDIQKMSEKFAYYKETNVGIHYIISQEENGLWHTYLIAINEDDYEKYKEIIDYTYERVDKKPEPIRAYGYPAITKDELKVLAIKNIKKFVPAENQVVITEENYEEYLTNSYLDTTIKKNQFNNILLYGSLGTLIMMILLLALTIMNKSKKIDNIKKNTIKEDRKTRRKRRKSIKKEIKEQQKQMKKIYKNKR